MKYITRGTKPIPAHMRHSWICNGCKSEITFELTDTPKIDDDQREGLSAKYYCEVCECERYSYPKRTSRWSD